VLLLLEKDFSIQITKTKWENLNMKNISKTLKLHWLFLLNLFLLFLIPSDAFGYAEIKNQADYKLNFDCNSLYYVRDNSDVYKVYDLVQGVKTNLSAKKQYDLNVHSEQQGVSDKNSDTIALGPNKNGVLTMYQWDHIHWSKEIEKVVKNQASDRAEAFSFPEFRASQPIGWSGGEVNQKTGEIYFVSYNQDKLNGPARMMIHDPATGGTWKSGKLIPANNKEDLGSFNVESDMAIDAEGNAYIIVSNGSDYRLLRVIPNKGNSNGWKYNEVKRFEPGVSYQIWGMAFLNGMLYVNLNFYIYEFNPLNGIVRNTGFHAVNSFDFTTCQAAPVIRGKIYNDANGDGNIDDDEKKADGVNGINVQIYDSSGTYLGGQNTSGNGEYSLLLPSSDATFYIRIKQPQINGANVQQTWASGGKYNWNGSGGRKGSNTVTPVCYNDPTLANKQPSSILNDQKGTFEGDSYDYYGLPCYGALANGKDTSSNNLFVSNDRLRDANYYSKVVMTTDMAVVHADFALGSADRGDAPSAFGEASHNVRQDSVKMGSLVDADTRSLASPNADGDDSNNLNDEDGVEVKIDDGTNSDWKSLKNFDFNNNKYLFRVKVDKQGFLNAWASYNRNSVDIDNFEIGTKIADNIEYNDDTGYIVFPADIDAKINTDGGYINGIRVSKLQNLFFRFRYSSYNASAHNTVIGPKNPPRDNLIVNNQPWVIDGEVEDYKASYRYLQDPGEVKGTFIIVNQNFNLAQHANKKLKADDPVFALYTQVVNKPFDVRIAYYKENGSGVANSFDNPNVNVSVALVDFNGNCDTSPVVQDNIYTTALTQEETIKTLPSIVVNKAVKNSAFKITYSYTGSKMRKTTCSPDTFAVRPESFVLESNFNGKLVGGRDNKGKIKAVESGSTKNTQSYNQIGANIISNAALVTSPFCALDTNVSNEFGMTINDFANGNANIDIRYQNIGEVNIYITDKEWTAIDSAKSDCIVNSGTNVHNSKGLLGCNIAGNKDMNFIPNRLEAEIVLGNANGGSFTYLSNDGDMSAHVDTTVRATLFDGATATNYQGGCFAKDVTYSMELINNEPLGWDNRSDELKKRLVFFQDSAAVVKNNPTQNGSGEFMIEQDRFVNGVADNVRFNFNFGRDTGEAENPFRITHADFNVTELKDGDTNGDAVINEGDINLFYGRAFIKDYEGFSPISAEVKYEVFCSSNDLRNVFGLLIARMSTESNEWFLNDEHNDLYGNISSYTPNGNTSVGNRGAINNGIGNITLIDEAEAAPYQDTIRAIPRTWLVNDPTNAAAADISFTVKFLSHGGNWAGKGKVSENEDDKNTFIGKTIEVSPSKREAKKIDW
jgi:hypothetical protein